MKYYIDLEFLEGTQNKTFLGMNVGKTKPTIDLVSIGIVSDEVKYVGGVDPISKDEKVQVNKYSVSREYYAISKDFNLKEAWNRFDVKKDFGKPQGLGDTKVYWLRENVLKLIFEELAEKDNNNYFNFCKLKNNGGNNPLLVIADIDKFNYRNLKKLINKYGKTNKQIAEEIKEFCLEVPRIQKYGDPEFYAYYADYDWVAFCWLFGKMIDLPNGFPMYCKDLKQSFDERDIKYQEEVKLFLEKQKIEDYIPQTYNLKNEHGYPKQTNEHNALADARWNKKLHEFLNNL